MGKEQFQEYIEFIVANINGILFILTSCISVIAILALIGVSIKFINVEKSNQIPSLLVAVFFGLAAWFFFNKIDMNKVLQQENLAPKDTELEQKVSVALAPVAQKLRAQVKIPEPKARSIEPAEILDASFWKDNWKEKLFKYREKLKVPTPKSQLILPNPKLGVDEKPFNDKYIYDAIGYVLTSEGRFYITEYSWKKLENGKIKLPTWVYVKQ